MPMIHRTGDRTEFSGTYQGQEALKMLVDAAAFILNHTETGNHYRLQVSIGEVKPATQAVTLCESQGMPQSHGEPSP